MISLKQIKHIFLEDENPTLRYLKFSYDFLYHAGKQLDKKAKVNFKIYDVRDMSINDRNTHIVEYFKKQRQPDNEIWPLNRI